MLNPREILDQHMKELGISNYKFSQEFVEVTSTGVQLDSTNKYYLLTNRAIPMAPGETITIDSAENTFKVNQAEYEFMGVGRHQIFTGFLDIYFSTGFTGKILLDFYTVKPE